MARKPVKAIVPVDNLDALLRAGALKRLQGNPPARPIAKQAKSRRKKR